MNAFKTSSVLLFTALLSLPLLAFSAEPMEVTGEPVSIDPTSVGAFYGTLNGEPHRYIFDAAEPIDFRVKVIMPDTAVSKRDISLAILDRDEREDPVAILDGRSFEWKRETDKNGRTYLLGPSWRAELEPGAYELRVWSTNNDSPYGIITGESTQGVSPICVFLSLVILGLVIWGVYELIDRRRDVGNTPYPPPSAPPHRPTAGKVPPSPKPEEKKQPLRSP